MPAKKGSKKSGNNDFAALAQEYKAKGNVAYAKADWGTAAAAFTQAIQLNADDHLFYSNRSACRLNLNEVELALEDALKCVSLAPKWAKGQGRVAAAYFRQGQFLKAISFYDAGLKMEASNEGLIQGKAEVVAAMEAKQKEVAKALADSKAAAEQKMRDAAGNPEDVVIGIDLGTTYSCVSVWSEGRVKVLPNNIGERTTPSWAGFAEDGERMIGQAAKSMASVNADRTFYNIKRIIGQSFKESESEIKGFPFEVKNVNNKPVCVTEYGDKKHQFAPEEISAMILEKMKTTAEENLGHAIKKAVITVPAYFNDAQRRATETAAKIAGLEVMRMINEPTAAALAYGLDKQGEGNILVFDLGGGTFDVSLLSIDGGMFKVLATAGDTHLGGEDFDAAMQQHLVGVFKKQNKGVDLVSENKRAMRQLRTACERAKRMLSSSSTAEIEITVNGEELFTKISRAQFEKLNDAAFSRCLDSVKRVLEDAKVGKDDVDEVVLVGGSTRIPKVQSILQDFFNGKALCKTVNPDEAVAYGAAVQGAILSGVRDKAMSQLILVDVTPLTLGIETEGKVMAKVVPRNTSIPCTRTKEFTTTVDFQTQVLLKIFEGERGVTDSNHLLGEFNISGIERAKQGIPKIDVTFEIDASGMLTVCATDQATGATANVSIKNDVGRHSQEDIDRMIADAEARKSEDDERVKEVEREKYGEASDEFHAD